MKKTIAILIAAVLVATALCACLTVSAASTNLALNADFIGADPTVGNQYTDRYNAKLNDGKAESEPNWAEKPGEWFGFYYKDGYASNAEPTENFTALATFTVDLKEVSSVDSVRLHMITSAKFDGNGVVAPITLTVDYSSDNAAWENLDTLVTKDGDFADYDDIDWVEVSGDAAVNARYIRVSIEFRGYTFMLNEVEVIGVAGGDENPSTESGSDPAETSGEASGDASEETSGTESTVTPVPTETKNVAEGKPYTGAEPSTNSNNTRYNAKLTDGAAKDSLSDLVEGDWFAFYCNEGAEGINAPDKIGTFVVDLEEVYTVSSVKLNTFVGNMWGIVPPESVKVEYSEDGETYSLLAEKAFTTPEKEKDADGKEIEIDKVEFVEFKGTEAVNARYIKVTVKLAGIFAFINEVQVMGEVPVEGGETSGTETSAPEASTSAPEASASEATTSSAPVTGESGLIGFVVLAVVALAGAAVAVKVRH